jgi:hypothetical protein
MYKYIPIHIRIHIYIYTAILGEMHAFRARDPRVDDIGEGMSPIQVCI